MHLKLAANLNSCVIPPVGLARPVCVRVRDFQLAALDATYKPARLCFPPGQDLCRISPRPGFVQFPQHFLNRSGNREKQAKSMELLQQYSGNDLQGTWFSEEMWHNFVQVNLFVCCNHLAQSFLGASQQTDIWNSAFLSWRNYQAGAICASPEKLHYTAFLKS